MHHANQSSQAFQSLLRWGCFKLRGRSCDFYKEDPAGYEAIARVFLGREEVAASVRRLLEKERSSKNDHLIVDAACGTGLVTDALAGSAKNVVGSDICGEMLDFARASKDPSLEFVRGDLHDFSRFEKGSIDAYSMVYGNRYIQNLQKFYADLSSALSDDGMAVITTAGMKKTFLKVQECAGSVGLVMNVVQPKFRKVFNKAHGTSHIVLKHAPKNG